MYICVMGDLHRRESAHEDSLFLSFFSFFFFLQYVRFDIQMHDKFSFDFGQLI